MPTAITRTPLMSTFEQRLTLSSDERDEVLWNELALSDPDCVEGSSCHC